MRPSNKSRNRNKNNNRRGSAGNNINRVFESAGPEGRVRGTPQQIIDKYISLTYDAQLSGDRVSAENFQQHAEHYSRLLIEAQKEINEKQIEQQANDLANKVTHKPVDESLNDQNASPDLVEKHEDKIVDFDKNVEKNSVDIEQIENTRKNSKQSTSRKIIKKRVSVDTKTI